MGICSEFATLSRTTLVACILLLVLVSGASAQARSTISGYVFGPGRVPVGQVFVELRSDFNSVIARTRTNDSGSFRFFGVPSGRLTVTVLPLGTNLEEQTQTVEIAGIGARGQLVPESVQLDIYLRPRKQADPVRETEVVFAQEVPNEAKEVYTSAVSDLDTKRTAQGIAGLQRAIEIFPTYFLALQRLGAEQLVAESYDDAVKSFRAALAVNQRCFICWHGVSYGSFARERWSDAVDAGVKAVEIEKNSVSTLAMVGIAKRHLKDYAESEKFLLRAKKLDNLKTPDIYWNLALLYAYNLKKYQDAADALELYLKANASMPEGEVANVRKLIKRLRENRPLSD